MSISRLTAPQKGGTGVVALVSGGVESCALVHRLLQQGVTVYPVYVRCGLVWERTELFWLRRWLTHTRHRRLKALTILDVPVRSLYHRHWGLTGRGIPSAHSRETAVYLPGRNVLLLSHAAIYAACHRLSAVAVGVLAGNPFGDAHPRFLSQLARCLTQALASPVRIMAPLRHLAKAQVVRAAKGLPIHLTFSCMRPRRLRHCGRCNKCAERQRAFRQAGLTDPTDYVG